MKNPGRGPVGGPSIFRESLNHKLIVPTIVLSLFGLLGTGSLSGCTSNDDDQKGNESTRQTKNKELHFHIPAAQDGDIFYVRVSGTKHWLTQHDAASRGAYRQEHPDLQQIEDGELTHFVDEVPLPVASLQLVTIMRGQPEQSDEDHQPVGVFIHHPQRKNSPVLRNSGSTRNLAGPAIRGAGDFRDSTEDAFDGTDHIDTPRDTAISVVFHHPELIKLDLDSGKIVFDHIENAASLLDLAGSIKTQYVAAEDNGDELDLGWAKKVAAQNEDGSTTTDSDGNKLFHYALSTTTKTDAAPVVKEALRLVKNDQSLADNSWAVHDGQTAIDQSEDASQRKNPSNRDGVTIAGMALSNHSAQYGIKTWINSFNASTRTLTITTKNNWLRHAGLYMQQLGSDGKSIDLSDMREGDAGLAELIFLDDWAANNYFVGVIPPVLTAFAIPIYGPETQNTIVLDENAASVKIIYGSMGSSNYQQEAFVGLVATAIMEGVMPAITLASGVGDMLKDADKEEKEKAAWKIILDTAKTYAKGASKLKSIIGDIKKAIDGDDVPAALVKLGKDLWGAIPDDVKEQLVLLIMEQMTESILEEAIPFVGWVTEVASVVATVAELAETTTEVIISPCVFENSVSFTEQVEVTIKHDPLDASGFPATATNYSILLYLDGHKTSFKVNDTIDGLLTDPIVHTFKEVPVGGKLKAVVAFYADDKTHVGDGDSGDIDNGWSSTAVDSSQTGRVLKVETTIKEHPMPLKASTRYQHKRALSHDGDDYLWQETTTPPTATKNDLKPDALSALGHISFHQKTGSIGYGWRAQGGDIAGCAGGASNTPLHLLRSLSSTADAKVNLRTSSCGLSNTTQLAYDLMSDRKRGYYIDSRSSKKHLRGFDLSSGGAISPDNGESYGYFHQDLDALIIHKDQAIGVNFANSKMEVLQLPAMAVADSEASPASLISGQGTREGLMHGPTALTMGADGTLLVLETINQRVQALDVGGNPVRRFVDSESNKSAFMPLRKQDTDVVYLDVAMEFAGYIYVLYYRDTGAEVGDYLLDIYKPTGEFLTSTSGIAAGSLTVDLFRNLYTLNYESLSGAYSVEPGVSHWIPQN